MIKYKDFNETFFAVKILNVLLDGIDTDRLTEEMYSLKEKDLTREVKKSNAGGWQSKGLVYRDLDDSDYFEYKKLINTVESITKEVSTSINNKCTCILDNVWCNINGYRDYNWAHIHPGSPLSGVFYVKVPDDHKAQIQFNRDHLFELSDFNKLIGSLNDKENSNKDPSLLTTWSIYPTAGQLILFPGHLEHMVYPNNSQEDRISIAFNTELIKLNT